MFETSLSNWAPRFYKLLWNVSSYPYLHFCSRKHPYKGKSVSPAEALYHLAYAHILIEKSRNKPRHENWSFKSLPPPPVAMFSCPHSVKHRDIRQHSPSDTPCASLYTGMRLALCTPHVKEVVLRLEKAQSREPSGVCEKDQQPPPGTLTIMSSCEVSTVLITETCGVRAGKKQEPVQRTPKPGD